MYEDVPWPLVLELRHSFGEADFRQSGPSRLRLASHLSLFANVQIHEVGRHLAH